MRIPLVSKPAQAGFLSGWGDHEYMESLPTIPYEVDREFKGNYVAFKVNGDSMFTGDENGFLEDDTLVCREVSPIHWKNKLHIKQWFFVLVHRDKGIVFKKISDHCTDTGVLTLTSLNDYYKEYTVNMDELIAIFNVVDFSRKPPRP
jgi:hypothetical protein